MALSGGRTKTGGRDAHAGRGRDASGPLDPATRAARIRAAGPGRVLGLGTRTGREQQ